MPQTPVKGAPSRRLTLDLRARLLILVAVAVAAPLAAFSPLSGAGQAAVAIATGLFSAAVFATLWRALRPLQDVAGALEACSEGGPAGRRPIEPRRMLDQIRTLSAHIETLRHSLGHAHPVTALPTRQPFAQAVAEDLRASGATGVVGVIRFADYEELAAFDSRAADRVLAAFAKRLEGSLAKGRRVAQLDSDRFAVWFPAARDTSELQALAYVLGQDLVDGDVTLTPQIHLGAALHPRDAVDPAGLLTCALAASAEAGRSAGKPAFSPAGASTAARERFAMGQEARKALQRNQLSLQYQPVVDVRNARVVGAEALLRWRHPELGQVSPADFVPLLEQSGQMEEVGLWVLNAACREARQWQEQGLEDLTMAVNLSTVQCRDPRLTDLIVRTLERHGLKPEHLELELTETAAMQDDEATRLLLGQLRDLGVNVAIDDFGAGYSSLTYLKNLPFTKLKIDREFVTRVDERRDSQAICSALIALAKGLDIRILAEGVERREELETLRTLGCPLIQGFYFSRPLDADAFIATITDPQWLALAASPVHRQRSLIDRRARP
jgi:EAL domain-containing protein (putative c-di-GMP-specific phosphodiesterase class I)